MSGYAIWVLSLAIVWGLGRMRSSQRAYARGYGDGVEWALWMREQAAIEAIAASAPATDVRYCERLADAAHPC